MSRSRSTYAGLLACLTAWLAYAAIELLLSSILTIAAGTYGTFGGWAWRPVALVFGCYLAAGAAAGLAAGVLLGDRGEQDCRSAAALSVALGFIANLLWAMPLSRSEYFALLLAGCAAWTMIARLRRRGWANGLRFLDNPWLLSLLLLAGPWISRELLEQRSPIYRLASSVAGVLLVALGGWLIAGRSLRLSAVSRFAVTLAVLTAEMAGLWIWSRPSLPAPAAGVQGSPSRPNVLLITMDTVRADHVSVFGYVRRTTPHLEALARESTVYSRAIAASDMTLPTHASIFTGIYSSWHGAVYAPPEHPFGRPLDRARQTLAEGLARQGYATWAVAGNYAYFQTAFGLNRGFEFSYAPRPVMVSEPAKAFYLREGARRILSLAISTSEFDRRTLTGSEISAVADSLLDRRRRDRPFFLFVNYIDAHAPYLPTTPFDRMFPGKDPDYSNERFEELKKHVLTRKQSLSPRDRDHLVSQYDGAIAYIDSQVGRLVEGLKAKGLYENTMIVITADHGEAFGEKNLMEHSVVSVYQNQVHVPLIIKYPGSRGPIVVDQPVSHVDLMPTILDVARCEAPARLQGESLAAPRERTRPVIAEAFPTVTHDWRPSFTRLKRALFIGSEKLIAWDNGTRESYNLDRDPQEQRTLAATGREAADARWDQFEQWIAAIPRPASRAPSIRGKKLEMLRSLGYAQ